MTKKYPAIIMVWLIIMWPLYTVNVIAITAEHSFKDIEVKGTNEVPSYVKVDDTASFSVTIYTDAADLTGRVNLFLNNYKEGPLDCNKIEEGRFECTTTLENRRFSSVNKYRIQLLAEDDTILHTKTKEFYVDNIEPVIESLSVSPELSSTGEIELSYTVRDYAYGKADKNHCSGVHLVKFYLDSADGQEIGTKDHDPRGYCSFPATHQITGHEFQDGEVKVCAVAHDKFDHKSDARCVTFTMDTQGVEILAEQNALLDTYNLPINAIKDSAISAKFTINITGADLKEASADFSALNRESEDKVADRCYSQRDVTTCYWNTNIKLIDDESSTLIRDGSITKSIIVKAVDNAGNEVTETIEFTLQYDNTGPTVTSLQSGFHTSTGDYAQATGNTFTADITEDHAGLYAGDVWLHIAGTHKATRCEKSSAWKCYWENININAQEGTIEAYIFADSKDRVGNSFTFAEDNRFSIDVIFDDSLQDTAINWVRIESINVPKDIIKFGDRLSISVNLTEPNGIKTAFVDLSSIIDGEQKKQGSCNDPDDEGNVICRWSTPQIDVSGATERRLIFNLTDNSGNELTHPETISVMSVSEEESDFYELEIDARDIVPIERETLKFIAADYYSQDIPFRLKFIGGCNDEIEIFNVEVRGQDCGSALPYITKNERDYNGFIEFRIAKDIAELEVINISACSLKFNAKCGTKFYSVPESENITIKIHIGTDIKSAESLKKEIKELKDKAKSTKYVDILQKIVNLAQSICNYKRVANNIVEVLQTIGLIDATACEGWMDYVTLGATCHAIEYQDTTRFRTFAIAKETKWAAFFRRFCNIVQCTGSKAAIPTTGDRSFIEFGADALESGGLCGILREKVLLFDDPEKGVDWLAKENEETGKKTKWGLATALYGSAMPSNMEMAKKSWIAAVGCFCVPGVIYNLHKKRQIDCWKGVCLRDMVPLGVPVEQCEKQDAFNKCVYWNGQWTIFLDILFSPIRTIFSILEHPAATAWTATKLKLMSECGVPALPGGKIVKWSGPCLFYTGMSLIETVMDIVATIDSEDAFKWENPGPDYCKMLLEKKDKK